MTVVGAFVALAVLFGILPARGSVAAAGAAFPLDVYFDVKHSLASASSWPLFVVLIVASVGIRSAVLTLTFWFADGADGHPLAGWRAAVGVVGRTSVIFLPVAVLILSGAAVRYAPFIWIGAPIGFLIATSRARKGVHLDVGAGSPRGEAVPETAPFLGYAYVVAASAAAISFIGDRSAWLAALLILSIGPLHALFLLGWRENARAEVYPGGGFLALTTTVVLVGMVAGGAFYDRVVRSPKPVARTSSSGSIALLGGSDSTSQTGALSQLDVRSLGYPEDRVIVLSYTDSEEYRAEDTRGDLDEIADNVARQLSGLSEIDAVIGHSQAALIFDRILADGTDLPPRMVNFAPSPPRPPHLSLPSPGEGGPGKPGGDLARGFAALLRLTGLPDFDIDAPASPTNLEPVVVPEADSGRLAIWALADSVWLDGDWRRPGELNVVVLSDHVGVTNNDTALETSRTFLSGDAIEPDIGTWRGILVPLIRYAFEPWRPENV